MNTKEQNNTQTQEQEINAEAMAKYETMASELKKISGMIKPEENGMFFGIVVTDVGSKMGVTRAMNGAPKHLIRVLSNWIKEDPEMGMIFLAAIAAANRN